MTFQGIPTLSTFLYSVQCTFFESLNLYSLFHVFGHDFLCVVFVYIEYIILDLPVIITIIVNEYLFNGIIII